MSTTIAIVLNVSGTAWAEAPDGSRRLLEEGSALMAGERLVTEDDARVQLDFGYDNLTVIEGGTTILATAEMAGDFIPASAESSLEDDSVAQALASIEAALGGSIEDAEAPAAGLEGGSSGGSSTVRLARIVENIDPAEFNLATSSTGNRQFVDEFGGEGEDGDLNTVPGNTTVPPGDISIDSVSGGSIASPTLIVSGSSSNLLPSSAVQVTITDQNGNTISQQIITGPNGEFTGVFSQVSGLVDGPLTVEAIGTGLDGGTVSDTGQGNLDLIAGALDVSIDNIDDGAQTIDLSGTTNDVSPGESVSITITDTDNNVVTTTAVVAADGSYSVNGTDISGLVDGDLTVVATAADRNGNPVADTANGTLDALAGDLDITSTNVDDTAETLDVAGTTTDVASGTTVNITITDANGKTVTTTAIVASDGSYSVTGADISKLVDGSLTVDAAATDRNGNAVTDNATDALNALDGDLTVAIDAINDGAQTIDLSGTTNDVALGESVSITITDVDNNVVNTTATVAADGSYSVNGTDISGLVDGDLTVVATATDRNSNSVSDTASGTLDALAGGLDITSTSVDDAAETLDVAGTTTDVATGTTVNITITDANGTTVTTSAIVASDGSYSVTGADISKLVDGPLTVDAAATDRNGNAVTDNATDALNALDGDLTVAIDAINDGAQTIDLSGTTNDVALGESVSITITDVDNNVVNTTATVAADGSYSVNGTDISDLVDGDLTVVATAADRNGNPVADTANGTLDALAGDLDITSTNVDDAAGTLDVTGTTTDVAPGTTVNITITDANGKTVTTTAIVASDGSYSVTGADISELVDGPLTVDAAAIDRNGDPVSDTANDSLDALAGNLTVAIDAVNDGAQTIDLSGTTNDVALGESVSITITDVDNNVVNTTATVAADGSYSVNGTDISGLVDGDLTVVATATDRNSNSVADTANGTLDALAGDLDITSTNVDDTAETLDVAGTTTDVATGTTVNITITDANGKTVTTTAIVASDGSYSVTGADISKLVDGSLTVDAAATDRNGNAVTDNATDALNALDGDLTVAIDAVNDGAQTIDLSGTTTDVADNGQVTLTITDSAGTVITVTTNVDANGDYNLGGVNVSTLVDGTLTVKADAVDRNGTGVTDTTNGTLDAVTGNLTVAIDALDDTAQTMNLSGTTNDVKPGDPVTITITDTAGKVITVNTTAGPNGAYDVDGIDVSTLVDGTLTVKADAIDRNGGVVSDTATDTLNANAPPVAGDDSYGTNAIQGLFGEYFAYQQGPDGGNLGTLARADAFIAANQADATFVSTSVNYRIGNGSLGSEGKLQSFLGTDAGSLSQDPENSSDAIIRMTGEIALDAGTYQFRVTADDGYRILVNGVNVAQVDKNQAPATNVNGLFTLAGNGPHSVEIVYWDQGGQAQLKIEIRPENGAYRILGSQDVVSNDIDSSLVTVENQTLTIAPSTLLDNDSDADSDPISIQSVQDAVNGNVSLDGSGNIIFTPDAFYVGDATFNYTVSDGRGGEDTATVTLNVRAAAGSLFGTDQADTLNAAGNDDLIRGLAGDDTLNGGAGNDILIGGSGGDVLTGGIGADVFRWALGEESNNGTTNDVVTDFTVDTAYTGSGQGDQLELSDLLQGANADGSTTAADISGYLMAEEDGNGDTVLYLNTDGLLGGDTAAAQQSITLNGVDMGVQTSDQFIDTMLNNGHIKIE